MLRRILGSKRRKMSGGCRNLQNDYHLISPSVTDKVIISRRIRRTEPLSRMGNKRKAYELQSNVITEEIA
jgi:hypothetical protein